MTLCNRLLVGAAIAAVVGLSLNTFAGTPARYTGSNGNWSVSANWSTNPIVPLNAGATTYDVTIPSRTVTYNVAGTNAINSLTLTSATLTLTAGNNLSVVNGLTTTGSSLNAQNAAFSDAGTVSLNSSNLSVSAGGSITLPGLTTYNTSTAGGTFQVDGATSHLTLANLAAISLANNGFTARAQNAGDLELNTLSTLSGTGSIFEGMTFLATGSSSILRANALTSLTMNGASITLQAQTGGYAEMTALAAIHNSGSIFGNFNGYADGAASKVNLPALTTIALTGANDTLRATAGGDLEVPLLATVTNTGNELLNLQATGSGSLLNAPLLGSTPLSRLSVTAQTGGTINWGQPTSLTGSSITLDTSGTIDTSHLTTIDSTSLTATNGATLSIPAASFSSPEA